ncbi:rhamnan synthesis F family protein [Tabrizicola sp.]|uniref:rhamnan synthesis F family protein n=1 Tax=Tabrizicola sp. TaxID=2005166 RepID=UPI002FDDBA9B
MIPGWKVRRELLRFRQQIAWYWELLHARRRTRQHDRDRPKLVQRHDGAQAFGTRIAALLIFQPGAMPASVPESCDLLTGLGYSVLVVSNGPLQPQARADLLPHVWRLLERPNLGYDFGGYREAVMHLWDEGADPDELLILNDSVWIVASAFPAFLDRLRAMEAEVTGSVLRSKKGKRWIESYFFRFNRAALTAPAFRAFWQGYRLVGSKFGVIRQGERDFSVNLSAGGLRVGGLGDNQAFLVRMAEAPDEDLRLALAYAAPVGGGLAEDRTRLLGETPEPHWRTRALAHLGVSLDGKRVWNAQFPIAGLRVMGNPFIKKSREKVNADWRKQVLRAIDDHVVPSPAASVLAELQARQADRTLAPPHWASRPD